MKRIHAAVLFDTPPFPEAFGGEALIRAVHKEFKEKFEEDDDFPAKTRMYIGTAAVSANRPGLAVRPSSSFLSSRTMPAACDWWDFVYELQQRSPRIHHVGFCALVLLQDHANNPSVATLETLTLVWCGMGVEMNVSDGTCHLIERVRCPTVASCSFPFHGVASLQPAMPIVPPLLSSSAALSLDHTEMVLSSINSKHTERHAPRTFAHIALSFNLADSKLANTP